MKPKPIQLFIIYSVIFLIIEVLIVLDMDMCIQSRSY
jgi:hypothetical protein